MPVRDSVETRRLLLPTIARRVDVLVEQPRKAIVAFVNMSLDLRV